MLCDVNVEAVETMRGVSTSLVYLVLRQMLQVRLRSFGGRMRVISHSVARPVDHPLANAREGAAHFSVSPLRLRS